MWLSNGAITVSSSHPQEIDNYKRNGYYEVSELGERITNESAEMAEKFAEMQSQLAAVKNELETERTEKQALLGQVETLTAEVEAKAKK